MDGEPTQLDPEKQQLIETLMGGLSSLLGQINDNADQPGDDQTMLITQIQQEMTSLHQEVVGIREQLDDLRQKIDESNVQISEAKDRTSKIADQLSELQKQPTIQNYFEDLFGFLSVSSFLMAFICYPAQTFLYFLIGKVFLIEENILKHQFTTFWLVLMFLYHNPIATYLYLSMLSAEQRQLADLAILLSLGYLENSYLWLILAGCNFFFIREAMLVVVLIMLGYDSELY